jgi:curved DNA-binding protein
MNQKDPYEILGVGRNAGQDEIKRAYRRLARQHHPDRNPGDKDAERRFKEVQAAYEVLGDPERRRQYDRFGAGGPTPEFHTWNVGRAPGGAEVHFDFGSLGDLSSIFEQFFTRAGGARGAAGARRPRRGPPPRQRGANIEHTVHVTLDEVARGTTRQIVLQAEGGAGAERIEFRVPAGVKDGQRIRLAGRGQQGPGGRGDLIVLCRVQPHRVYRREGLNLIQDATISFPEAVFGAKVEVPTPDGPVRVTIPPGTQGGARLRLRECGIQDARSGDTGDMYVIVRISVPREPSPEARELIEKLAEQLGVSPHTPAAAGNNRTGSGP